MKQYCLIIQNVLIILPNGIVVVKWVFHTPPSIGDLVVIPRKVRRGVKAKTDMIVLHVVSPSPTSEKRNFLPDGVLVFRRNYQ